MKPEIERHLTDRELLDALTDCRLRWHEDPQSLDIVRTAIAFPHSASLVTIASRIVRQKLLEVLKCVDPFIGNYPMNGELKAMKKPIVLGRLPSGTPLRMELDAFMRHVILVGPSGGGKTSLLRFVIPQIVQAGGTVICFDRKGRGELVDSTFLQNGMKANILRWQDIPLAPLVKCDEGIPDNYWANVILNLLSSQFNLIASTTLLTDIVHYFYSSDGPKCWSRLVDISERYKPSSQRDAQYRSVILLNLKSVLLSLGSAIDATRSNAIEQITRERGVCQCILTDGLSETCARLLPSIFMIHDFEKRRVNEELHGQLTLYILDDSMSLMRKNSGDHIEGTTIDPLNSMSLLARSLGMGLCFSLQNFSQVSELFVCNADCCIACGSFGKDCFELSKHMSLTADQASYLSTMRPGEAVIMARSAWPKAVLCKIPFVQ